VIAGGCVSTTVIVNVHDAVLDEGSVAVHVMVVVPSGNVVIKLLVLQVTVADPLLSVAVARLHPTTPVLAFAVVATL